MQVASLDELRAALRTVTPGETIELAHGEYQGPIFIDAAVTLRGLDRKTVLWRRGGPVIYVRAPGVTLSKLLIERTVTRGPLIVHKAGCAPTGGESMTLNALDALISLGELVPGSTLTLPLEIETSDRAEVNVSGLYGAQVAPGLVESAGKHTIWLTLDGNAVVRGEILLGELALREAQSTRFIWLSGTVLDAPPTDHSLCLAAKKTRLYPSPRGLVLDSLLLSKVDGFDTSKLAGGRYAFVQRDQTGSLSLYLPGDPPDPVSLNGNVIAHWTRVLLREKDTIKIGSASLSVVAAEPVTVRADPPVLVLPEFSDQFPEAAKLTLQNTGKTAWKGHVIPVANWIGVTPDGDFRMPPNRSNQWSVQMNAEALALPDGTHDVIGGLLVVGSNQMIGLDVRATVRRPDVVLQVAPVDAGSVEWGWPVERSIDVTIGNLGRGTWTGNVRSSASWLNVVTPMPITCGPWSESIVQVQIAPDWESLPVGTYDLPAGLIAENPETPVSVRLQVTPPQPHLVAVTPLVAFDQVERNAPLPEAALSIRNEGAAPWTGMLHALNGWVRLSPAEITSENPIAPGATAEIAVHLLDVPAELALDTPVLIDEIRFDAADPAVVPAVPLAVGVQLTVVELPPFLVANTVSFGPFVKGDTPPEGLLRIHNNGPARWRGTVVANTPWLNVPDGVFTCEPGTSIELYCALNGKALDALQPGLTILDDALSITGGREPVTAAVHVDLREPISELHVETPTLNFGQVDGSLPDLPSQVIRLVNASPAATTAKVELCVPWLSVQGAARTFDLSVPGMNIAEFTVTLNDGARWLPPGLTAEDRAVLIAGREKQIPVRALLILNEWSPLLSITPNKLTVNGDSAQALAVRNTSTRPWNVQVMPVPWLIATPTELSLEPDQERTVEIKRASTPQLGAASDPRAIVIVAPGREYDVEVALTEQAVNVTSPHPRLATLDSPSPNSERGSGSDGKSQDISP